MADDEEPLALGGGDSPWAHDHPIAAPAPLPSAWAERHEPPQVVAPVDRGGPGARLAPDVALTPPSADAVPPPTEAPTEAPTPGHPHRRTALTIGLVGLLAAAAIGSQIAGGGDDGPSDDGESAVSATASTGPRSTAGSPAAATIPPVSTEQRRTRPSATAAERLPEPPAQWVTTAVALDPRVAATGMPTELVALGNDGVLHVIDTASGMMHSIDTGGSGSDYMVSLGAHAVMLSSYSRNETTLARVGEPLVEVDVDGGIGHVIERAGSDELILVPNSWNPASPEMLQLGADGQPVRVSSGPLVRFDPWQIQFLRSGQMIVNDTGGVYLVDGSGAATRISTGELMFVGANHYIVRECDETLTCVDVRVEQSTGQRDLLELTALDRYRQWNDLASMSLSPDGTAISYNDWMSTQTVPSRRVLDLTTGVNAEVAPADQFNTEPAWAADSSGLFVLNARRLIFFDRASGEQIPVAPDSGLDDLVAVAARPLSG